VDNPVAMAEESLADERMSSRRRGDQG